jgi:ketosteroid isomerase-like protein
MLQENVELTRKAIEEFNRGGIEAFLRLAPADVVWYPLPGWVEERVYRGRDGVRRMGAITTDLFDDVAWDVQEIREVREQVLVRTDLTGRTKDSGTPIRQPFVLVVSDFRDGLIGETRFYSTWQEALKAVGLAA